ncbi:ABC transporter ATP-binding protein/permease, partial [Planktomarina sp.]|nr:ABC transporter ATP-binding protein/permease [Planktomarina sp.]
LLALMILAAMLEVIGLGAVLPFIGMLTEPEAVYAMPIMQPLNQFLNISEPKELIFPVTIIFVITVLTVGMVRLVLLYASIKYSNAVGADLSIAIYRQTLFQDYSVHVSRNSSEIISGIITKTNTVTSSIVTPLLNISTAFFLISGISTALFFINIQVAIFAILGFGFFYSTIIIFTKKHLKKNGECIAEETTRVVKSLQEGLGGIRDVLVDNNQEFYADLYRSSDLPLRKAIGNNHFVQFSPRFVMEAIGMSLIAIIAYVMTQKVGSVGVLPILGALAIGAQRLLPSLQQAYSAYTAISGSIPTFEDTMILLRQPLGITQNTDTDHIEFKDELRLRDVSFRHAKDLQYVLKNINLTIKKGSCTGFVGVTGSGKTTLLDIIMLLLDPTSGEICVDDRVIDKSNKRLWQANISHVPQTVFLSDASIEENIAFGVSKHLIDYNRVESAAKKAELSTMIHGLKDGYQTKVGERGLMLSGGQRQRIGIARALYKQSSVLIFDEATSALDSGTEKRIMDTIHALDEDLTILTISHRITTLKKCDQIIDLSEKNNMVTKTYEELTN